MADGPSILKPVHRQKSLKSGRQRVSALNVWPKRQKFNREFGFGSTPIGSPYPSPSLFPPLRTPYPHFLAKESARKFFNTLLFMQLKPLYQIFPSIPPNPLNSYLSLSLSLSKNSLSISLSFSPLSIPFPGKFSSVCLGLRPETFPLLPMFLAS